MKRASWTFLFISSILAGTLAAQTGASKPEDKNVDKEKDDGIPVTSELVRKSCGGCHSIDDKQRMSRISYRRTTPEGWEHTIKRMVALNGVKLEPAAAREILQYLASNHGLAPDEARPASFEAERRLIEYHYTADKDTEGTCTKCHSFGRVLQQRRTKREWELLVAMHRGYYPYSDFQAFRRMGPVQTTPGPDGKPPDNRQPMDKAISHLSGVFPLKTPQWSAWSANMRTPKLEGRWAVTGYQAGKGPIYGDFTIEPGPGHPGEFRTHAKLTYARSGAEMTRDGSSVVYTGYQWRGRSKTAGDEKGAAMREVIFVDPNMREMTGRWFNGAYDENGIDVKLVRVGSDPLVLGLERKALKAGTTIQAKIYGANLPTKLDVSAVDFGQGVTVKRVVSATPQLAVVELEIAKDAKPGLRDVFVAGSPASGAAVVYDKIDAIKVRPQANMARLGGANFQKGYAQFEAFGYTHGPDGKPDTPDDIELGPVDVSWSIEEFAATYGDDDKDFVGKIDQSGFFTPNIDGPNPKRHNGTNNWGDVWVVASFKGDPKPLRARAHLLVTVPLYIRYDTPEVAP